MFKLGHLKLIGCLTLAACICFGTCQDEEDTDSNILKETVKNHIKKDPTTLKLIEDHLASDPSPALRSFLHLTLNSALFVNEIINSSVSTDDGHTIEVPQAMDVLQTEWGTLRTKFHGDNKT